MNNEQHNVLRLAGISNLILGGFLIVDALFLHLLTFNYGVFGTSGPQINLYVSHSFYGLFFVFIGLSLVWIGRRRG